MTVYKYIESVFLHKAYEAGFSAYDAAVYDTKQRLHVPLKNFLLRGRLTIAGRESIENVIRAYDKRVCVPLSRQATYRNLKRCEGSRGWATVMYDPSPSASTLTVSSSISPAILGRKRAAILIFVLAIVDVRAVSAKEERQDNHTENTVT